MITCSNGLISKIVYDDRRETTFFYYPDGNLKYIYHYLNNGNLHKENGPSFIEYDTNANIAYEAYLIHGQHHREDGPAIIQTFSNHIEYTYYINDKRLEKDDFAILQLNKLLQDDGIIITKKDNLYVIDYIFGSVSYDNFNDMKEWLIHLLSV